MYFTTLNWIMDIKKGLHVDKKQDFAEIVLQKEMWLCFGIFHVRLEREEQQNVTVFTADLVGSSMG